MNTDKKKLVEIIEKNKLYAYCSSFWDNMDSLNKTVEDLVDIILSSGFIHRDSVELCPLIPDKYKHIQKGQIWVNDRDYKVEILDLGEHELWLRYAENNQRCAWKYEKFLEQYSINC